MSPTKDELASVKLTSVHLTNPLFPVLNSQGFSPNFRSDLLPLWTSSSAAAVSEPCTIDLGGKISQTIRLALSWQLANPGSLHIKAISKGGLTIVDSTSEFKSLDNGVATLDLPINTLSTEIPWGVKDEISWRLVINEPEEVDIGTHALEVYALSRILPAFLIRYGLPS